MKNNLIIFMFLISIYPLNIYAQLISNPDFESYTACPTGLGYFNYVIDWRNPSVCPADPENSRATVDYYNACYTTGTFNVDVPTHACGTLPDHGTGQAYAAIVSVEYLRTGGGFTHEWSEYIQCHFTSPLILGRTYRLKFYVAFNSTAEITTDIGYIVSTNRIDQTCADAIARPLVGDLTKRFGTSPIIPADNLWHEVTFEFVATDCNMEYLTIGKFPETPEASITNLTDPTCFGIAGDSRFKQSYCYIDDVSLEEVVPLSINFTPNENFICLNTTSTFTQTLTPTITGTFDYFEWYLDGVIIPGATGTTYTTSIPGEYEIRGYVNSTSSCPRLFTAIYNIYTSNSAYDLTYLSSLCQLDQTFAVTFPPTLSPTPLVSWEVTTAPTNATITTGTGISFTPIFLNRYVPTSVTLTIDYGGGCIVKKVLDIAVCCNNPAVDNVITNFYASKYLAFYDLDGNGTVDNTEVGPGLIIDGTFLVDVNLTLNHLQPLKFAPGSKIIIQANKTLNIIDCHLIPCADIMWQGIELENNTATLNFQNSILESAIEAIVSNNGGVYTITNSNFNRNYKNIVVNRYNGIHTGTISSTSFTCQISTYSPITTLYNPHLLERTFIGVDVDRVTDITIGERSLLNSFDNMNYGIQTFNTRATIRNNSLSNIVGLAADNNSGSAIIIKGTNDAYAFGLGINLIGSNNILDKNMINNAVFGIASEGLSTNIINNSIDHTIKGIVVRNTSIGFISPNHINIEDNIVNNTMQFGAVAGVAITENNNNFTLVRIVRNSITNGSISGATYSNTIGIFSNTPIGGISTTKDISNNTITQLWKGISITRGGGQSNIENNIITMNTSVRTPPADGIGIELLSTSSTVVECNSITGTNRTKDISIFLSTSPNNIVRCNSTINGLNGLRLLGNCVMHNSIYGNSFSTHYDYIFLTNSGYMGSQLQAGTIIPTVLPGNRFLNTGGYRAKIRTSLSSTGGSYKWNPASGLIYSPNTSSTDGTGIPPAIAVPILIGTELTYACPSPCLFTGFALRMGADVIATENAIDIINASTSEAISQEQVYETQKELYKDLELDPSKYNSEPVVEEFKETFENTDAFKLMEAATLIANKETDAASIQINEVIAPNLLPQILMKEINLLQLDTIYPDTISSKYIALMDIATTCPTQGGEAVYIARSELMKYYGYIDWDDNILCNPETANDYSNARRANPYSTKIDNTNNSNNEHKNFDSNLLIFPNPISDYLNIHSFDESNLLKIEFINLSGSIAKTYFPKENRKFHTIETTDLSKGLYVINCIFENGNIKSYKISII